MGMRNRLTRESLEKVDAEEFEAFLDDVACEGLKAACESRLWTQSATLNWIAKDEERGRLYTRALQVRAEIAIHEGREIVDGATPDDVAVAKLRSGWRQWEASKWNRDRYGEKLDVKHGGAVGGLTIVLAQLPPAEQEKVLSPERIVAADVAQEGPEAVLLEADAGETVPEPSLDGRVSSTGVLPPEASPRLSVIHPTSYDPI